MPDDYMVLKVDQFFTLSTTVFVLLLNSRKKEVISENKDMPGFTGRWVAQETSQNFTYKHLLVGTH